MEENVSNLVPIYFFDFCFQKTYQTYFLLMQEDLNVFLFIRPVKAAYVPTAYSIHWGLTPMAVREKEPFGLVNASKEFPVLDMVNAWFYLEGAGAADL